MLLLALAILAAVVVVYIALVVRKVLIVITAVFAPVAFAGSLADITVGWVRRWVEVTVALVVSKLVLVLIFVVGYFMLVQGAGQASSGVSQQVTQVVAGAIVLALAGFAPWLALRLVHFTGDHAQQLHAMASASVGGAVAAGGWPRGRPRSSSALCQRWGTAPALRRRAGLLPGLLLDSHPPVARALSLLGERGPVGHPKVMARGRQAGRPGVPRGPTSRRQEPMGPALPQGRNQTAAGATARPSARARKRPQARPTTGG